MIRTTGALHRRWLIIGAVMVMVVMVPHSQLMLQAANDHLDPTFGKDGKVRTDFLGGSSDFASGLAIQFDGKIVAVGSVDGQFGLARYTTNGSLDPAFGSQGKVTTTFNAFDIATAVALQRDGKIVVAGTAFNPDPTGPSDFAVARYNANGSLDATFGVGGKVTTDFTNASAEAKAIAIQADGKIVVVGQAITDRDNQLADMAIARYNRNGALDLSFDGDGKATADLDELDEARAVAVSVDGKIVVAGLARRDISLEETIGDFGLLRFQASSEPAPPLPR